MAKTVKMCDMPVTIAIQVFERLNSGNVMIRKNNVYFCTVIVSKKISIAFVVNIH